MALVVLLAVLPAVLISAIMVADSLTATRQHMRERMGEHSRTLALALDRELGGASVAMEVLAATGASGDLASLTLRANAVAVALGHRIMVHGPDSPIARSLAERFSRNRFGENRPVVGDLAQLRKGAAASIYQPVLRDGLLEAVLETHFLPVRLSAVLMAESRGRRAMALALDSNLTVIASTGVGAPQPGSLMPPWLHEASTPEMLLHGRLPDGSRHVCATSRPDHASSWVVAFCEPSQVYDSIWETALLERGAIAIAFLGIGLLAAARLTRRLARPLSGLAAYAQALPGGPAQPEPVAASPVAEFETLRLGLRNAARQARSSQKLLASVLGGMAEPVDVKDADGRYVVVNRAAVATMPVDGDESRALGRTVAEMQPPELARAIIDADKAVMLTGQSRSVSVQMRNETGEPRLYAVIKTPWRDETGRIAGIISVMRDETEARAAEAKLRALQAELLRATRLSAMGAMASGLAHEVNQPLSASTNFLNATVRLLDRAAVGDVNALRTAREAAVDAATQLLRAGEIVRRLREFVSRGEAALQPQSMEVLIREACDLARADGAAGEITLATDVAADTGTAPVDRTQIQQVLLNLIRNAAEAIQGGGADPDRPDRITVSARRNADGGVTIDVADTGPGLCPEVAGRMFEPFVSTKLSGTGIGLTICRTIIEGHGGRLTAQSVPGGGTVFRILLPPLLPAAAVPADA